MGILDLYSDVKRTFVILLDTLLIFLILLLKYQLLLETSQLFAEHSSPWISSFIQ